jgi:hypothetical protein
VGDAPTKDNIVPEVQVRLRSLATSASKSSTLIAIRFHPSTALRPSTMGLFATGIAVY